MGRQPRANLERRRDARRCRCRDSGPCAAGSSSVARPSDQLPDSGRRATAASRDRRSPTAAGRDRRSLARSRVRSSLTIRTRTGRSDAGGQIVLRAEAARVPLERRRPDERLRGDQQRAAATGSPAPTPRRATSVAAAVRERPSAPARESAAGGAPRAARLTRPPKEWPTSTTGPDTSLEHVLLHQVGVLDRVPVGRWRRRLAEPGQVDQVHPMGRAGTACAMPRRLSRLRAPPVQKTR